MCGRFSVASDPERLAEQFEASLPEEGLRPNYNAAPNQSLPVILNEGKREIELLRWGLVPHWAKDLTVGSRFINARAETVGEKRTYKSAFQKRRCLVLADGFYEWQSTPAGRVPLRFLLKSEEPFAFAGLWETWKSPEGSEVRTFTVLTTEPNSLVAPVHNRMPVILLREHEKIWLDNTATEGVWQEALKPYPAELMRTYAVSKLVNSPKNNDPSLITPV